MRLIVIIGRTVMGRGEMAILSKLERKNQKPDLWPQRAKGICYPENQGGLCFKETGRHQRKPPKRLTPKQSTNYTSQRLQFEANGKYMTLGKSYSLRRQAENQS